VFINDQVDTTILYDHIVKEDNAVLLGRPCSKIKIREVLKSFAKDKSLGPNGWTVEFFIHFFDLVGDDLLDLVEDSRLHGSVNKSINMTFLTHIPKVNNPLSFGDYIAISLCNLCYKLISKIIANRLMPILSRSLSEEQLGFLKGRQILDAIDTDQECLHSIKVKNSKAMILMLDLKKAYDCINWDFLRLTLIQSSFNIHFLNWILSCINSGKFVVLINEETSQMFKSGRGLRQGCPLSPMLFILITESLILLLKKEKDEGNLSEVKVSRLVKILHFFFVDDVLIMNKSCIVEWLEIKCFLMIFYSASGMLINCSKSIFIMLESMERL
jgi:hypothetical protein